MRNPAGSECKYFYGNYHRGQHQEECRLLETGWTADLCRSCPVPAISRANGCEHMRLRPRIERSWRTGFQRRVRITTYCIKSERSDFDAYRGCGECHSVLAFTMDGTLSPRGDNPL